jgi:hypothetical protein
LTQYVFTEADKREFNRLRKKIDSIKGPGVVNTPTAIYVNSQTRQHGGRRRANQQAGPSMWIRITGYAAITGATNRWKYQWVESQLVDDGMWEDVPDGNTHADLGVAYNSIEANNSDSGVQGNSTNVSTLPPGYSLQPVQGNPVVQATLVEDCNDVLVWIFSYENGVSAPEGNCP